MTADWDLRKRDAGESQPHTLKWNGLRDNRKCYPLLLISFWHEQNATFVTVFPVHKLAVPCILLVPYG